MGLLKGLGNFTTKFLGGIWHGMGPEPKLRTIKTPYKEGTLPRERIREAVRKVKRSRK